MPAYKHIAGDSFMQYTYIDDVVHFWYSADIWMDVE